MTGLRMMWTRNGYEVVGEDGRVINTNTVNELVREVEELKEVVKRQQEQLELLRESVRDILLGMRYST